MSQPTKEWIEDFEAKIKVVEKFYSTKLNGELKTDGDKIALYVAFSAMDEWASQQSRIVAIEFKKWLSEESDKRVDILKLTDDQLYNLYLEHKTNQQ